MAVSTSSRIFSVEGNDFEYCKYCINLFNTSAWHHTGHMILYTSIQHSLTLTATQRSNVDIQGCREISANIVTDDYLCYKEPKCPYNFFFLF